MKVHLRLAIVLGAAGACAAPGETVDPGAGEEGREQPPAETAARCNPIDPGPAPVRRLTRREYNNSVHDLLGTSTTPANGFQVDGDLEGFANNLNETISVAVATDYMMAAETLAASAVGRLPTLLPSGCLAAAEPACAERFVVAFAKRAFRRPLQGDEQAALLAVYQASRAAGGSFSDGVRLVVTAVLQSPSFLLHVEKGVPDAGEGPVALTDHEVAARLSYTFWQTLPDAELMAAADEGRLRTQAEIEAQARRMLADHRSRDGIRTFYDQWLGLDQLATSEPGTAMRRETRAFIDYVLWNDDARVETLLGAPYSFLNADLAKLYQVGGITGTVFQKVDLGGRPRAGVLTQGAFLTASTRSVGAASEPIHRGLFVRERLLCNSLPPPTGAVASMVMPPPDDPKLTTRQRFERFFANPYCTGCHRLINPLGLGMENYDGLGRYRTTENGLPIDARGTITGTEESGDGGPISFDGLAGREGMAAKLARSSRVQGCLAKQWLLFATSKVDLGGEGCATRALVSDFAASGGNLRELLVALVKTDTFRFRTALVPEACQ